MLCIWAGLGHGSLIDVGTGQLSFSGFWDTWDRLQKLIVGTYTEFNRLMDTLLTNVTCTTCLPSVAGLVVMTSESRAALTWASRTPRRSWGISRENAKEVVGAG